MSETKLCCSVVRDLLPLYFDEVVESDTAALVEEHLKNCAACREELERLRAEVPPMPVANPGQAGKKLVQQERKHAGLKTLLATIATLLVGLFLWIGVTGWFPVVPVSAAHMVIESVENTQDDCSVTFRYNGCWAPYTQVEKEPDSGTVTITMRDTPYRFWGEPNCNGTHAASFQFSEQVPITQVFFNGELVWTAD